MIDRTQRQIKAVDKWVQNKCKGCWVFCTGFGKTFTSMIAIKRFYNKNPNGRVTVIVPTEVLKEQWENSLKKQELKADILIINSAIKKQFETDLLIIDEIHKIAAESFSKIFVCCKYSMIIGLTATFERLDGKEILIKKYCPVIDTISVKEATKNGWLSPALIYKVIIDVPDIKKYENYNSTFMNHFAYFQFNFNLAMSCVTSSAKRNEFVKQTYGTQKLQQHIKECTAHAFAWMKALKARKEFVQKHSKKFEIAKKILKYRPNSKAITFNATIKDCENYGFGTVIHSKQTKRKNSDLLEKFNSEKIGVVHSSKALNEGVDIHGLNLAIILYNTSSSIERIQKYGRVIRAEEGKVAEIFSLVIRNTVEENWFKSSARNTTFIEINESELDKILKGEKLPKVEKYQKVPKIDFTFK